MTLLGNTIDGTTNNTTACNWGICSLLLQGRKKIFMAIEDPSIYFILLNLIPHTSHGLLATSRLLATIYQTTILN